MSTAEVSSTSVTNNGKRSDFLLATPTPRLWTLEHDDQNYYVKLRQSEGIKDPTAILAKAEGDTHASFFKLAGIRIVT